MPCVSVIVSGDFCRFKLALPSLLSMSKDEVKAAHSDFESIRIWVHQLIQPLTHLPIIDIDKNRDYSIYSTEAISIVYCLLSCCVNTKEPLNSITVLDRIISYIPMCFHFEISVNYALIMYEFQSFGNVFCSSDHIFCSRSFCRETRYIVLISENVLHQVLPAEFHDKDWSSPSEVLRRTSLQWGDESAF